MARRNNNLIAFTCYSRGGKDEAAKVLIENGWKRHAFGDIIKQQIDSLVRQHLGFSAFTEVDAEKQMIRGVLEQWGESNYANIRAAYFDTLPPKTVNVRLCREDEAVEWQKRGGLIVEIKRKTNGMWHLPATDWEQGIVQGLRNADLVDITIVNDASPEHLRQTMRQTFVAHEAPLSRGSGSRPRIIWCSNAVLPDHQ